MKLSHPTRVNFEYKGPFNAHIPFYKFIDTIPEPELDESDILTEEDLNGEDDFDEQRDITRREEDEDLECS